MVPVENANDWSGRLSGDAPSVASHLRAGWNRTDGGSSVDRMRWWKPARGFCGVPSFPERRYRRNVRLGSAAMSTNGLRGRNRKSCWRNRKTPTSRCVAASWDSRGAGEGEVSGRQDRRAQDFRVVARRSLVRDLDGAAGAGRSGTWTRAPLMYVDPGREYWAGSEVEHVLVRVLVRPN